MNSFSAGFLDLLLNVRVSRLEIISVKNRVNPRLLLFIPVVIKDRVGSEGLFIGNKDAGWFEDLERIELTFVEALSLEIP